MGQNLMGDEARIWNLHSQGFPPSRIAGLLGLTCNHVRDVITGVWFDDKQIAKRKA